MKKDINNLRECGNLLESLLNPEVSIDIIRFWTYETRVSSILWEIDDAYSVENIKDVDETELVYILKRISDYCRFDLHWMDNKYAIELRVNRGWHIFVGFWDWHICIGQAICPNCYPPKMIADPYGCPTYIKFR